MQITLLQGHQLFEPGHRGLHVLDLLDHCAVPNSTLRFGQRLWLAQPTGRQSVRHNDRGKAHCLCTVYL